MSYQSPSTGEGFVYLLGGIDTQGTSILPSVLRSRVLPNGSLEEWQPDIPMSVPSVTYPSLVYNNRIYTLGDGGTPYRMTTINPNGTLGQWTTLTTSPPISGVFIVRLG